MANKFIVTINNNVTKDFALKFLKSINFISSVKPKKQKNHKTTDPDEIILLAEPSIADDWLSDEDDHWDQVI